VIGEIDYDRIPFEPRSLKSRKDISDMIVIYADGIAMLGNNRAVKVILRVISRDCHFGGVGTSFLG
jgi:hypothetical protein